MDNSDTDHPIEGQVILLAGARASVTLTRLSDLIARTHTHLGDRREAYDRRFERLDGVDGTVYYLADPDHWTRVGEELGFSERETDAVERAHAAQFRRDGRRLDQLEEFESALEIRDVVALAEPGREQGSAADP